MEFLLFLAVIGLLPAAMAKSKGRSFFKWWLYGALLFIVAAPHALLARPRQKDLDQRERKAGRVQCPQCAEWIRPEAKVCKHCGRDVPPTAVAGP
jgi:hypothetical protein